ncbi:hypothetical protein ACQY0O_002111 [Thecaphora frezii]
MAAGVDPYLLASTIITPTEHIKIALQATQPLPAHNDAAHAAPATPALSPQDPRRIFVVVSNVESSVEQACLLVLKPRSKDPHTAALLKVIPILPSIDIQLHQRPASPPSPSSSSLPSTALAASSSSPSLSPPSSPSSPSFFPSSRSFPSIQSIFDAISQPIFLPGPTATPNSSDAKLGFTISCAGQSARATTTDTQGLKDFLSVLRDLAKVAKHNAFSLATSHQWLSNYTDDLPLARLNAEGSGKQPVPIFERFSKSAILARPHADHDRASRPPSPTSDEIRLSVGTFNVAGLWPKEDSGTISGMKRWLRADEDPDLVVLGFQEVDTSGGAYLYYSPAREDAWTRSAVQALGRRAGDYTKIASRQLVGLLILVFARDTIRDSITDLATASIGVGLGGFVANKGAVAVRMQLGRRSLCFVNSHLSAFEGLQAMERRCWDWCEIYKRLKFKVTVAATATVVDGEGIGGGGGEVEKAAERGTVAMSLGSEGPVVVDAEEAGEEAEGLVDAQSDVGKGVVEAEEQKAATDAAHGRVDGEAVAISAAATAGDGGDSDAGKPAVSVEARRHDTVVGEAEAMSATAAAAAAAGAPSTWETQVSEYMIRDHDIVINVGDLNFRLDLDHSEVHRLIQRRDFAQLYRYDQLEMLRSSGSLFGEFEEGEVRFPPTYKFDKGTDRYDTSEKRRVPAWTDRVLWCVASEWEDAEEEEEDGGEKGRRGKQQRQGIVQQRYESVPDVRFSDHRPVRATFLVRIR